MLNLALPLLIGAMAFGDGGSTSSDAEIERDHELFAGSWKIQSVIDNGEDLGTRLVALKLAKGGQLDVKGRSMSIISPETGETRSATFLVDPGKTPRQIDVITKNDHIIRGIYLFHDDGLTLCLQTHKDKERPAEFAAPEGSGQMLVKLKLAAQPITVAAAKVAKKDQDILPLGDEPVLEKPVVRDNGPTEAELRRAHEMLAGSWDILGIVDDGESLGADLVRAKFAENGRIRIGTHTMSLISPKTDERRVSGFHIDPSKSPSEIDITTHFDEVLKGIYRFSDDQLWLCLAKRGDEDRPTDFESNSGSGRVLMRLKMVKPAVPETVQPVEHKPSFAERVRERDEQIRSKLVGSWVYYDTKGRLTIVLQADGNFVATRTWSKGLKRLFEGDTTTSMGHWSYQNGILDARVSSTQDPRLLNRLYSMWLQSVGDDTLVIKNIFGQLKTAQRLR
ncbi:TIGR03067 domain-containing protein [Singulisphaera sp. PoT]|uniref:TIGR03067 domain-containing protein n=1 Tax=Singulisphaera sp. PoT TaxID=3411797 RepID=UPI003BF559E3